MGVLSPWKIVIKVLKNYKNDVLYTQFGKINNCYNKWIDNKVDDIDDDKSKIDFYETQIRAKKTIKLLQKANVKSDRQVEMNLYRSLGTFI